MYVAMIMYIWAQAVGSRHVWMLEGAGVWAPGGEIEGKGAHAGAFGGGHVWGPSGTGMYSRAPSQPAPPPSFSVPS